MGLLTTRIEGAGISETHGQWDSLESSLAVANPRGAIPNITPTGLAQTEALCEARARKTRARASKRTKTDTY